MKKFLALLSVLIIIFAIHTQMAMAVTISPLTTPLPAYPVSSLASLTHNCPNTGIMVPAAFSPFVTNYLLTVASWVSKVQFTTISTDPGATIFVNGQYQASGETSQEIQMTNDPQMVSINVVATNGESTVYTVFLQRRPSDARTKVSVGYLKDFYKTGSKWYAKLDLVTVTYGDGYTNYTSAYTNDATTIYKHAIAKNCLFYMGDQNNPQRLRDPASFRTHVTLDGGELFRVIYLEDEIVALIPYDIH